MNKSEDSSAQSKVSIVVPVYNAEAFLHRCMQSLLSQTYQNTEIILVDDGSSDGSGMLCDKLAAENGNIKAIHIEEKGVSAARNLGIDASGGGYITFVDADDCPAADMVEHLVRILAQTDSDVSGCSYREFYSDEEAGEIGKSKGGEDKPVEILAGKEFIKGGILNSDTRCWSKLYRRESIKGYYFDTELTIGEDMLFLLKLAQNGKKFCRSGYKGYGYFINRNGAMMRSFQDSYIDQITCWQKALAIIADEKPEDRDKAEAILLISIMLVAGKLAMLPGKERKDKGEYVERCARLIKKHAKSKKAFHELDRGYRMKISLFRCFPDLYMKLYHMVNAKL